MCNKIKLCNDIFSNHFDIVGVTKTAKISKLINTYRNKLRSAFD